MTGALEFTRRLPGPPTQAFRMWTVPALMEKWLFASDAGVLVQVEADPVVGGRYSILELNDGVEVDHFGHYLVLDPPHALRFTFDVPQHFPESTVISVEIEARGAESLLRFCQTGIDPEKTRRVWGDMLDRLATSMA